MNKIVLSLLMAMILWEELPAQKPRHLLGIGEPLDILLGIENGIDTFDCVAATRVARNGALYTKYGFVEKTHHQNDCHELLEVLCTHDECFE